LKKYLAEKKSSKPPEELNKRGLPEVHFSSHNTSNIMVVLLLLLTMGIFLLPLMNRPIWFDEAWSIMVYTTLPYSKIYLSYSAPNNHILLNILLKLWINSVGNFFPLSELTFRLFSMVISGTVILLMFRFWYKRLGVIATYFTILSFSISTPFLIYGSALRGYMLSLIFVLCGLEAAMKFTETARKKFLLFYFLSALGSVAVIPSNVFVFAIIAILPLPKRVFSNNSPVRFLKERWLLAILPLLSFLLFYGPIWQHLYFALKNNNGWLHPTYAILHLYAAFSITLLPLISLGIIGGGIYVKSRFNAKFANNRKKSKFYSKSGTVISVLSLLLIFIAPAMVIICKNPAPFPRVFFQVWPIWLFITGIGIKHIVAANRSYRKSKTIRKTALLLSLIIIGWGFMLQFLSPLLSRIFTRRFSQDDFFQPYYMKASFNPLKTVETAIKLTNKQKQKIFLSQYADFPSLIFYGKLKGVEEDFWITDYPGKKTLTSKKTPGKYYIIVKEQGDLFLIKRRFHLKKIKLLNKKSLQKIYEVKYGD